MSDDIHILDVASAAREVAIITALALMQSEGDPAGALRILDEIAEAVPSLSGEVDCASVSAQAIREAVVLRGGAL